MSPVRFLFLLLVLSGTAARAGPVPPDRMISETATVLANGDTKFTFTNAHSTLTEVFHKEANGKVVEKDVFHGHGVTASREEVENKPGGQFHIVPGSMIKACGEALAKEELKLGNGQYRHGTLPITTPIVVITKPGSGPSQGIGTGSGAGNGSPGSNFGSGGEVSPAAVPEPGSIVLVGIGLTIMASFAGIAAYRKRWALV